MPIGLIALALGGFGIGLTEFGIVGLLPEIARDFQTSESTAGLLVSGYALSVAIGALLFTAALARFDRKNALLGLMLLFIAGNLVSAVAPGYGVLLTGRIVAALCHGAFFSVGAVVASDMVAPNKKASAVALMFGGLTAANVLGVPLGTFLGQQLGWRSTFWAITVIGIITLIGIQILVPKTPAAAGTSLRRELSVFRRGQVWFSILLGVLTFGSVVGAFTYIAFTLTEVSGFATTAVPWLLVLFGVGTFVGNFVGGKAADKALDRSLIGILAVLTVVLALFALTAHNQIATIIALLLMGTVGLSGAPGLQVRGMKYAQDAPSMASAATIAAFNVGNAIGAWIGGLTLAAGLGFVSPLWVGAALALAGLVVAIGAAATARRQGPPVPATPEVTIEERL
ncbi:MFS transporter [Amycolatopsis pithecellobii]|uniref:MFS transporter n=1 Tax=Amycolatopsis pithecellobii TaxID=664692 RepID=A0A6N7YLA9_9PSEU|nr:MFS transporter [Amycolatopsis pithecellobii]MTD52802.1 MFS transporter [Amycolatopsis pithecellobii]